MSVLRHFFEVPAGELRPQVVKFLHTATVMQNSAGRKRQHLAADGRYVVGVYDYRRVLSDNLAALLQERGQTAGTIKAYYLSGPRKGKRISERMIRYILALPQAGSTPPPSPALDVLAGIAQALGVPVHLLLLPGLDPVRPPVIWSEAQVRDAQEVARAYARLLDRGYGGGELGDDEETRRAAGGGVPPLAAPDSALAGAKPAERHHRARKAAKRH